MCYRAAGRTEVIQQTALLTEALLTESWTSPSFQTSVCTMNRMM